MINRRMQRREYQDTLPVRKREPTRAAVAELLTRHVKQSLTQKGLLTPKLKMLWNFTIGTESGFVRAHTRSEARAGVKKLMRIKSTIGIELNANPSTIA